MADDLDDVAVPDDLDDDDGLELDAGEEPEDDELADDDLADDEVADVEDRAEASERVLPKQPDEFVCRSCFLVKHPSQLADKKKMLCRDCV